jgi:phage FluMu gp28-like protein
MNNENIQTVEAPLLLDWQLDVYNQVIYGDNKYTTVVSSRQLGKSTILSVLALHWLLNEEDVNLAIVSLTYRQLKVIYNTLNGILKQTNVYLRSSITTMDIELSNGNKVIFLTAAAPDAARGFTFTHALMDEAAFYPDEYIGKVLQPTLLVRGRKVVAFSTPRGKNEFSDLYEIGLVPENKNYVSFSYDYTHNPYLPQEEIQAIKMQLPAEVFTQEYECSFEITNGLLGDLGTVALINEFEAPKSNKKYYAGVDLAIQNDYAVCVIFDDQGNVVDIYRNRTGSIKLLEEELIKFLNKWKPVKTIVEKNNIGVAVIETLWQKFYKNTIEEFVTTNKTKADIVHELKRSIEEGAIALPTKKLYPELHKEFYNFSFKLSKTREIVYGAKSGHDDIIMALCLANHCYRKYTIKKQIKGQLSYKIR